MFFALYRLAWLAPGAARIVLLNALVGLVTGGLFWKFGLEHAMVVHFKPDLVRRVAMPLAGSL